MQPHYRPRCLGGKENMKYLINHVILSFFFALLFLCGCEKPESKPKALLTTVRIVSDSSFTMGEKQAVSIFFGGDKYNYFDVTILRQHVYEGYIEKSEKMSEDNEIDSSGLWKGVQYFQSSKHDTFVYFYIEKLDRLSKIAVIGFGGKFVGGNDFDTYFEIPVTKFKVTGELFDNLVMNIK